MEKQTTMHIKHKANEDVGRVAINAYNQKFAAADKRKRKNQRRLDLVEKGAFR